MRIASKAEVKEPIRNPLGEVIYELIGAGEGAGGTEKHSVAIVTLPPGKSSTKHHHRVSEESYYVLQGMARMVIDSQSFQLRPGQACLIEPGEQHQIFNPGDEELEFIAISAPAWAPEDSVFV
jgi:mannose-6-phosphate isomerase-like protein (cupin superfamily)